MQQRPMQRIQPGMPPAAYLTYRVDAPLATHWRPATCEEVNCPDHLLGWQTILDETTPEGQKNAQFIRRELKLKYGFYEEKEPTGLTVFTFAPGQTCFKASLHRVKMDKQENYLVTGGDWRGNPRQTPTRRHTRPEHWVEDFGEHQDKLKTALERG